MSSAGVLYVMLKNSGAMKQLCISNALLRCSRSDDLAGGLFELVNSDLNLWVLELPNSLTEITEKLLAHEELLHSLSPGSSDYTLHITCRLDEYTPLTIPVSLSLLAGNSGIKIELYGTS